MSFVDYNADQGFEEISDILKRYFTLRTSNESLMKNVQEQEDEIDDLRTKLLALLTEKENSSLVNNSLMQHRQKMLDNVRVQAKLFEQGTEKETESQKDAMRDLATIVQGVRNLFIRCQASSDKKARITASKESSLSDNLSYNLELIHSRCRDLIEITAEYDGYTGTVFAGAENTLYTGSGSTTLHSISYKAPPL